MEKLLEFIKAFIGQFIAVFQDYRELAPISPEKRKGTESSHCYCWCFFRSNSVDSPYISRTSWSAVQGAYLNGTNLHCIFPSG